MPSMPGKSAEEMKLRRRHDGDRARRRGSGRFTRRSAAARRCRPSSPSRSEAQPAGCLFQAISVVSVDGQATPDDEAVADAIRAHRVGEKVSSVVVRNKVNTDVTVTTVESNVQSDVPVVGITLATGYRYDPKISFDLGQQMGGPGAGLVFALAIYDKITDRPCSPAATLLAHGRCRAPAGDLPSRPSAASGCRSVVRLALLRPSRQLPRSGRCVNTTMSLTP